MFRKIATIAAVSSLLLASTAAQASSASALSLRNAPAYKTDAATRIATTPAKGESRLLPGSPLFFILGVIGVVAILEVTGAINIFHGDDTPDSP